MAAKKATKSGTKKDTAKKADKKPVKALASDKKDKATKSAKVTTVNTEEKTSSKKSTKAEGKNSAKKISIKSEQDLDSMAETPSTLVTAAEKEEPKKKRMTKKQIADQSEKNELTEKWAKLKDIDHESKPQKYKMSEAYEPNTPIDHPVFGWGFILSLNENKLEVLFESGIKMLVSNLKV